MSPLTNDAGRSAIALFQSAPVLLPVPPCKITWQEACDIVGIRVKNSKAKKVGKKYEIRETCFIEILVKPCCVLSIISGWINEKRFS
jgi:hypothetical protein